MRALLARPWCLAACALLLAVAFTVSGTGPVPHWVVKGRIVAVDSELPIVGAKVRIKGLGTATTGVNGRYRVRARSGAKSPWKVVISKRGYRRRKTWLSPAESDRGLRADWNLLPRTSDIFDLTIFDWAARYGERTVGTSRWEQTPQVRIITNTLDCGGLLDPDETCPSWAVTTSVMSNAMMTRILGAIESIPALTGGMVPTVEVITLPPNTTVSTASILVPGVFTFGEYAGRGSGWFPGTPRGSSLDGYVYLVSEHGTVEGPAHIMRRMAGGLGLAAWPPTELCADLFARGLQTVLCLTHPATAATTLDGILGRALYTRAVGNRYPDADPAPAARAPRRRSR